MQPIAATPYPLTWPSAYPRSDRRCDHGNYRWSQVTIAEGADRVRHALSLLRVRRDDIVISTNVPLAANGSPRSNFLMVNDPGVAVYFRRTDGKDYVLARDYYRTVGQNLNSLGMALEALSQLERHGGDLLVERAFTGFVAALPMPRIREWREVLGAESAVTIDDVRSAYRAAALKHHPDHGGSTDAMAEVNEAWEKAQREMGAT